MSEVISAVSQKKAVDLISELIGQTLDEEMFTVNSLAPDMLAQLPLLFSDSVVDSVTNILGENSGEALVRSIGEESLRNPEKTYERLDAMFHDGSEMLKAAIREDFRVRLHRLYMMVLDLAPSIFQLG